MPYKKKWPLRSAANTLILLASPTGLEATLEMPVFLGLGF